MSSNVSSRLKHPKKHELVKSHSQAQILANKLRQDGVLDTVHSILQAVEQVSAMLSSNVNENNNLVFKDSVINLCQHLKVYGAYLEILYKEQLDYAFKIFRDKAQDDKLLDMLCRLHLLELIELRAKNWKGTEDMNFYYKNKLSQCSQVELFDSSINLSEDLGVVSSSTAMQLAPGEVIKSSGKFTKPTRISGKKYCKDEIIIRNGDSGKVMGIKGRRVHMIEELSETIISFQRVSTGAKERLVQITGANEESITYAKQLIEDTIRRNASPVREPGISVASGPLTGSSSSVNSSTSDDSSLPTNRASRTLLHSFSTNDANIGEYKYTVTTQGSIIKITGDNLDLVRTSKLVLDEYFSGDSINDISQFYCFDGLPKPIVTDGMVSTIESSGEKNLSYFTNGQENTITDNSKQRLPRLPLNEILKNVTLEETESKRNFVYTIEFLAQLARSPLCLTQPNEWERICNEHPCLTRKNVEFFDAKHYLSIRTTEPQCLLSADEYDPNEV